MVGRVVMVAAVSVEALGGFLPWLRSGERSRSGFELVDSARSLDVLDAGWQLALGLAWYLAPLAAALCWLAVLLDRRQVAAGLAVATGLLGVTVTLLVERATFPALLGLRTTLVASLAAVAAGSLELIPRQDRGTERRTTHELAHEP